jgi:hypothetical protein
MPKGGLSYKSLTECLSQAKAKGMPASSCDSLRNQASKPNEITPIPPPSDPGTRGAGSFKKDRPPVGPGTNISELDGRNRKKGLDDGNVGPYPQPNPKKKYGKLDR